MTCVPGQKWPNQLVLVRHGTSLRNEAKSQPGITDFSCGLRDADVPLSDLGIRQAMGVGGAHKNTWDFDLVYSSPYLRCRQTAEYIIGSLEKSWHLAAMLDDRLREIEWGIWDGLSKDEIARRHSDLWVKRQRQKKFSFRPPAGESWLDVAERLRGFLGMLIREAAGRRVLVVAHSVTILVLRYLIERMTEDEILKIDDAEELYNCSVTEYVYDPTVGRTGKLVLKQYNSVYYWDKDCFNDAALRRREETLRELRSQPKPEPPEVPVPPVLTAKSPKEVYESRKLPVEVIESALLLAKQKNDNKEYLHEFVMQLGDSPSLFKLARDLVKYILAQTNNDNRAFVSMACLATAFAAGMEASDMLVWGKRKPQ